MTTYSPTSSATLITAAASAVAGDTISIQNNITAASINTTLTVATGVTVLVGGFTVTGFCWSFDGGTSGQYVTPTTITGGGGTFDVTNCDNAAKRAAVVCARGIFFITDLRITGVTLSSTIKTFEVEASSTARCELTATNLEVDNSNNDCVSSRSLSGGTCATGTFAKFNNCDFHDPGAGSVDNCITSHDDFPMYMYGGSLGGAGGGPLFNSGPNDVVMELYSVAIDMTSNPADCNCSALVGCTITGTPGAGVNIAIHSPTDKAVPGIAAFNSTTTNLVIASSDTDVTKPPVIYGNTLTVATRSINQASGLAIAGVIARNTITGPTAANGVGIETRFTMQVFNNTIDVPSGPAATVYPFRLSTPTGGSQNLTEIRRCLINQAARSITYCGRSDAGSCAAQIYECVGKANTAFCFDSSSPFAVVTNTTFDGTNPNSYEVGAAYICDELKLLSAYGLEGWDDAVSPVNDVALYYGLFPATGVTVTANSSTQCTVGYENENASATDHRIERATDSGFTTGLTTFDVSAVAAGSASYVDSTCSPDTTYYYRVRAKNGSALSITSNSDSDTTPAPSSAKNILLLGVG